MTTMPAPHTGAEALLMGLKANGIDYLFANAGTDFPPIIEALVRLGPEGLCPQPLTIPHETAAVAMAHGYYLVTGRPQAVMVHVNVGLANAVMGAINAASDNVPVLLISGRTPLTETGRPGGRTTPIQYGQEMYDQAAMVREVTKFSYEMRYPEQGGALVARALAIAMSEPRGPVYLSLPREPLCEAMPEGADWAGAPHPAAVPPVPDPAAIAEAARLLAGAESPLILCQRGDVAGRLGPALSRLADAAAVAVVEPFPVRNVMASADPMFLGYRVDDALAAADVVLVVDTLVPWIEALHAGSRGRTVIHLGPDPLFARMPVRGFRADLAIAGDPVAGVDALAAQLAGGDDGVDRRRAAIAERSRERRRRAAEAAGEGTGTPISAEWMSRCLSEAMDEGAVVFNELGAVPGIMDLKGPNRFFNPPHSGGLGWGMPAALGACLAAPDRLAIACVGDGSYMFANPVACHQIAEALELPILTIVKNNRMWNAVRRSVHAVYPDGAAARANRMPLVSLEPSPDYVRIAEASRAHAQRVTRAEDLPAALQRALSVIRGERRQALLELDVAVSDRG